MELEITDDALEAIALTAKEQKTGARGLRGIMESVLNELMFDTPSDDTIEKITINADVVNKKIDPIIQRSLNRKSKRIEFNSSKVIEAEEVS